MKAVSLALVAAAGLLPALGFSATVVYSDSQIIQNLGKTSLSLNYFDSGLGTLTGVNVAVGVNFADVSVELDNDSLNAQWGLGMLKNTASGFTVDSAAIASSIPSITVSDFGIDLSSGLYSLGATSGDPVGVFNAQPGATDYAIWGLGSVVAGDAANVASGDLSSFVGMGNFLLSLNTFFYTTGVFQGGDGKFQGSTPDATFKATVTYTYAAIPEPATYALILGVCTLGFIGWRRFRK